MAIKMNNRRLVSLVKPFYKQTDSERLVMQVLRHELGATDEKRAEIFAKNRHVCVYCECLLR